MGSAYQDLEMYPETVDRDALAHHRGAVALVEPALQAGRLDAGVPLQWLAGGNKCPTFT